MAEDARLAELQFLARFKATPALSVCHPQSSPERDLIVSLINRGMLNSLETQLWTYLSPSYLFERARDPENRLAQQAEREHWDTINRVLGGQETLLRIGHLGRVRLSELEQSLKSGRERDKFNILLDGRHLDRALRVFMTKVEPARPFSIVFADMNDLKKINTDLGSHEAADEAVKTFLAAFEVLSSPTTEVFSRSGDEVVALMENVDEAQAVELVRGMLAALPTIEIRGQKFQLGGCAGVASTVDPKADPEALRDAANALMMKKAKVAATKSPREDGSKRSVIA
jgi:diguanylate cyclase (GGDEF)-like protein